MRPALSSPMTAWILERCRPIADTSLSATRFVIPSCLRHVSGIFGADVGRVGCRRLDRSRERRPAPAALGRLSNLATRAWSRQWRLYAARGGRQHAPAVKYRSRGGGTYL